MNGTGTVLTYTLAITAGGLGAVARHLVSRAVDRGSNDAFPWGTAAVNVTGAVVLGVLAGLVAGGHLRMDTYVIIGGGFLGAYTTFSTWMVETVALAGDGSDGPRDRRAAVANIVGPLLVGLAGAAAGYVLGGTL